MSYTPSLKLAHSKTLKRIAWALNKPMTKALANIIDNLAKKLNREKICKACQDRSWCESCPFQREGE